MVNSGCMETGVDGQQKSVNSFISLTPTVIVPLISGNNDSYKVRTLLDSGSESNWIARDVLKFIKHTKLDSIRLKVRHFSGVTPKRFDLVQIYIKRTDKWKPDRKSLRDIGKVYDTLIVWYMKVSSITG